MTEKNYEKKFTKLLEVANVSFSFFYLKCFVDKRKNMYFFQNKCLIKIPFIGLLNKKNFKRRKF